MNATRWLAALVAIEALVIVYLLVNRDVAPIAPRSPSTTEIRESSPPPPTVGPGEETRTGGAGSRRPGGVFLFGRVSGPDGRAPGGTAWVTILTADGRTLHAKLDEEGWYGNGGLAPGTYDLKAAAKGLERDEATVTIPGDADSFRHDFVLSRAVEAAVFILTPAGEPFVPAVLRAAGTINADVDWVTRGLSVVVTNKRPGRLPPTFLGMYTRFGQSEYRPRSWGDPKDERSGTLTIRGGLPAFVSVCARSEVIETIEVTEPRSRIEFRIAPERLLDLLAGVTFRVAADADRPDLSRYTFSLSDRQSAGPARVEIDGDRVTIRNRPPGGLTLAIIPDDRDLESFGRNVVLEGGRIQDLGTIHLRRAIDITGTVVDADGKPLEGVTVWAYDLDRPFEEQAARSLLTTARDGTFRIRRGPRRYCVTAGSKDHAPVARIVDSSGGPAGPITLRIEPGVAVRLEPKDAPAPYRLRVFDGSGRILFHRDLNSPAPCIITLSAGAYELLVIDRHDAERRIPFTVGAKLVVVR